MGSQEDKLPRNPDPPSDLTAKKLDNQEREIELEERRLKLEQQRAEMRQAELDREAERRRQRQQELKDTRASIVGQTMIVLTFMAGVGFTAYEPTRPAGLTLLGGSGTAGYVKATKSTESEPLQSKSKPPQGN